jgi:hypothetical protein
MLMISLALMQLQVPLMIINTTIILMNQSYWEII